MPKYRKSKRKNRKKIEKKIFKNPNKCLENFNNQFSIIDEVIATNNESRYNLYGSIGNDYLYGFEGNNIYQFGTGYDVIDYSYLPENITLIRGGTVNKGSLGIDQFTDFYEKIIATKNNNDWIDGISNGGFIASLEINLSYNQLTINNLPGIGSISSQIEKFEHISGTNNSDKLIGDSSNNILLGNDGDDFLFGKRGIDTIEGDLGQDIIYGGLGKDYLKGGEDIDTFIYKNSKESRLTKNNKTRKLDWIRDFNTNEDKIYFSDAVEQESFVFLGNLNYLSEKNINKALKQSFLSDFDAVGFNLISNNKTFIAINGTGKGFQSKNDLIIDITGFSGEIENINIFNDKSQENFKFNV